MALSDYAILTPLASAGAQQDWDDVINRTDGLSKEIRRMQRRALSALAEVEPAPTTPEKLAWTTLWSRAYVLLQAADDLQDRASARLVEPLYRMAFELWLQVMTIREPWERMRAAQISGTLTASTDWLERNAWTSVRDRLRGYAAWALTNDLRFARERLRARKLAELYQTTPPAPADPFDRAVRIYFFGEPEIVSSQEAAHDRRRAERQFQATVARLEDWLRDPGFANWVEGPLKGAIDGGPPQDPPGLFEMFDERWTSAARALDGIDMRHLFGTYQRCSMLLHGSSIELCTFVTKDTIIPRSVAYPAEGEPLCTHLAELCNITLLALWALREDCVPNHSSA